MNRYKEIRTASQDTAKIYRETFESLSDLREFFLDSFDCSEIETISNDYTFFTLVDETLESKGLKYTISYVHETNKVELYLSGQTRKTNDQFKAILGLEGGLDWIYMFVLSEDYEMEEEDENEDVYGKAISYMEFIDTEIEDIL